jgi:alkylation response protein AidB-like acyl-CoA dehydrogenase
VDFDFTPEEEAHRSQVRAWLENNIPDWWRNRADNAERDEIIGEGLFERLRDWHRKLYDAGYVGLTWPKEYGGQGRGQIENAILQEELVLCHPSRHTRAEGEVPAPDASWGRDLVSGLLGAERRIGPRESPDPCRAPG